MLSWLFVLITIVYTLAGRWPLFFKQIRIGKNESQFVLYKFRTLSNKPGSLQQRRFWLGDFMRFTSIDELPQIINVLRGDMSFVGPRPLPVNYLSLYSDEQRQRHRVLPGITGWAQVNGRNQLSWQEKFKYDIYYVNNATVLLDLEILLKTCKLLLSFKKDVSLKELPFTGDGKHA